MLAPLHYVLHFFTGSRAVWLVFVSALVCTEQLFSTTADTAAFNQDVDVFVLDVC